MGKGEIARFEQFLLFPLCFQKACFAGASKDVIVWEWVKLPTVHAQKNSCILFFHANPQLTSIHTVMKNSQSISKLLYIDPLPHYPIFL